MRNLIIGRVVAMRLAVCIGCALVLASAAGSAAAPAQSPVGRAAAAKPAAGLRASAARSRASSAAASAQALPASVAIGRAERPIPSSYLGLSIEYTDVAHLEQAGGASDRAIALIGAGDNAPMILRVGGASADRAWWEEPGEPVVPRGVFAFGRPWLAALEAMLVRDRLRALLDLNLAVHSPALAASFAGAAEGTLRSALAGVEIGNEPDHYGRQPWLTRQLVAASERSVSTHWTRSYTPLDYEHDYVAYAQELRTVAAGIAIGAPELASPAVRWLQPLVRLGRLTPTFVSMHRYASSSCWPKDSPRYPTIALMLSERVTSGLAASLHNVLAFAAAHHIPLRVTELGTISCGGNPGIADSFATALWAPDILFQLLKVGVSGVNWHLRPDALNAPFALTAAGIDPRPVLYGLAVFAQMIRGPRAVLARSTLKAPGLHLKAWAVRHARQTSVLLINKGLRPAVVTVDVGRARSASVVRLTAPSARSIGDVRYGGRWIGSDGRWHGRQRIARLQVLGGDVRLLVPGASAAVIKLS